MDRPPKIAERPSDWSIEHLSALQDRVHDYGTPKACMRAPQCKHVTEVDWPGHTAILYRHRCRNHTTDKTGLCHAHR